MASRVAEMERKLEGILNLLSQTISANAPTKLLNLGFGGFQDVISWRIVDIEQAEEALQDFAGRASAFPLVLLRPYPSLKTLQHERPVVLLAVLVSTSVNTVPIQNLHENELRETISSRIIMQGESSLDSLQGIPLCLAW
ncbi:hypothetical protein NHQ30_004662 [Ciborinia camelliae]|nr:hypothetical protein NHQ30_004662 [Ciborinia camelliae]